MSKAFTKEDDDAGSAVASASSFVVPIGPFHITARGAEQVRAMAEDDARLSGVLERADIVPAVKEPERAALGVTVHVLTADGEERFYRLVTSEERGLTGEGCSLQSPIGQALLGAEQGDVRVARTPRGREELEVVALIGDAEAKRKPKARPHAPATSAAAKSTGRSAPAAKKRATSTKIAKKVAAPAAPKTAAKKTTPKKAKVQRPGSGAGAGAVARKKRNGS